MRQTTAILLFLRPAQLARRRADEPYAALPWEDVDALFTAVLGDVIQNACQVPGADVILYRNPSELSDDFLAPFGQRVRCCDIGEESLSQEVCRAIDLTFAEHYHRVIAIIDNHPAYSPSLLRKMIDQLGCEDDCVVLNPTIEGRCSVVGMKLNHSWIFDAAEGDPLASPHLLMERLCKLNAVLIPAPPSYLLNTGTHLARLKSELEALPERTPDFPRRTFEIFKMLDKKYKLRRTAQ